MISSVSQGRLTCIFRFIRNKVFVYFFFLSLLFFIPTSLWAATYYVAASGGSDSNDCLSSGAACATIQGGINKTSAGDTLNILAGDHTQTSTITLSGKDITIQGAGLTSSNMTRVIGATDTNVFTLSGTITQSAVIKNLVIQMTGAGDGVVLSDAATSPTIERNFFLADYLDGDTTGVYVIADSSPLIQNNIFVGSYQGIIGNLSATIINNTAVNSRNIGFLQGDRANNIAYANYAGFYSCNSDHSSNNNTATRNTTNYIDYASCSGSNNNINDPRFINEVLMLSSGLTASTLTASSATGWTADQFKGKWITPDINRDPYPVYFLILSNTASDDPTPNQITVAQPGSTAIEMTTYGSTGNIFQITDFKIGNDSPAYNAGLDSPDLPNSASLPSTDIFDSNRNSVKDLGAVKNSGSAGPHTTATNLYVKASGGLISGNCQTSGTACTIAYAMANAYESDIINFARGRYTISSSIKPGTRDLIFQGAGPPGSAIPGSGYDSGDANSDPFSRLQASADINIFDLSNDLDDTSDGTIIRNLVFELKGAGDGVIINSSTSDPLIEKNYFLADYLDGDTTGVYVTTDSSPLIQNNIFVGHYQGIIGNLSATIINNTVVNSRNIGFLQGDRANNIAYANYAGFYSCNSDHSSNNNTSYGNEIADYTDYGSCGGSNNRTLNPSFVSLYSSTSSSLTASVLTATGSPGWTTDQWVGYWVTPNSSRSPYPIYYLIIDNDSNSLTVAQPGDTAIQLTDYSSSGDTFQITSFIPTATNVKDGGQSTTVNGNSIPTDDIFGVTRSTVDMGAVENLIGVTVTESSSSTDVTEGSTTDTYTVVLTSKPAGDVTITPSSADSDYGATVSPSSLTFTTANWNSAQTITVTAVNDTRYEGSHTNQITHSASSSYGDYNGTSVSSVTANISDNDSQPSVTLSLSGSPLAENGGTATVTATLSNISTQTVTVNLAFSGTATLTSDYTRSGTSITISAGSTTGTVTLTGVDDSSDESNETVIVDIDSVSNGTESGTQQVTATLTDDDTVGVTISESGGSTNVTEASTTDTYTVVLTSQPSANVTITPTSGDTSNGVTVSPSSLTFTTANWNSAQTITVTAANDSMYESSHTASISHAASSSDSAYNGISISSVTANITDNDSQPTVTLSIDDTSIAENSEVATVTASLSNTSSQTVTVNLSFSGTTAGTDYTASATSISITTGNSTGTVTLTASDDSVDESSETVIVDISSVSNGTESGTQQVTTTIVDNDTAGVTLSQSGGSTSVTEGGTTDTYTLVLTSQPTADVTLSVSPNGQQNVNPTSLTFTSANWSTPQTITITAVDDDIAEGNHTGSITHAASSSDAGYNGISISSLTPSIVDNDSAGVSLTSSGGSTTVTEDGATDTYTVVLTSEPTADVTITVSSADTSYGTTVSPSTLTFTSANWDSAQTVTVTAVDDDRVEGSHSKNITHSASSSDSNYQGISISNMSVTITDNDTAGVTISESGGSSHVSEAGDTDTYTIVLTSDPASNVVVSISTDSKVSVSPSSLTFTSSNWSSPQTVTITATNDSTVEGDHASTLTHSSSSSDSNYQGISISDVVVSISDDDSNSSPLSVSISSSQTMVAGQSVTLSANANGGDSNYSYQWSISEGSGSLSSESGDSVNFTASEAGSIIVSVTVTDGQGSNNTGSVALYVIDAENIQEEEVEEAIVGVANGNTIYEEETTDSGGVSTKALKVGNAQYVLPSENSDYTYAVTQEGYLVIGIPAVNSNTGRVYFSDQPLNAMSGTVDLSLASQSASTVDFSLATGNQEDDEFGKFLATGDLDGDGRDEIVVGAPGASLHGILYVFNSSHELVATIFGSEEYPVSSALISNYLNNASSSESPEINSSVSDSAKADILLGPNNPALNANLRRQASLSTSSLASSAYFFAGQSSFSGSYDLASLGIDGNFGTGAAGYYQSAAFGDINQNGETDLVLVTDDGNAYLYFNKQAIDSNLSISSANVVITGASSADGFGRMVAIGDVSGDGVADIVIGAPEYGSAEQGAVYVIFGASSWPATLNVSSSSRVLLITGKQAGDGIGSDLLLTDANQNGSAEIYTIKGANTVYKIDLVPTSSPPTSTEPGLTGGASCNFNSQNSFSLSSFLCAILSLLLIQTRRFYCCK